MKHIALAVTVLVSASVTAFQADAQDAIKIGHWHLLRPICGCRPANGQRYSSLYEAKWRYGFRPQDRDHPQGLGGPSPEIAKRLAQELVVRDKVDILAGFVTSPEALPPPIFRPTARSSWSA